MRKVPNYVTKVYWSDEDLDIVALLFQDSVALPILMQMLTKGEIVLRSHFSM